MKTGQWYGVGHLQCVVIIKRNSTAKNMGKQWAATLATERLKCTLLAP